MKSHLSYYINEFRGKTFSLCVRHIKKGKVFLIDDYLKINLSNRCGNCEIRLNNKVPHRYNGLIDIQKYLENRKEVHEEPKGKKQPK